MKQQPELAVYEIETSELVPYVNNAKLHSEVQIDQIAKSIEEFGFNDPVAIWENASGEREIVEGHGRVLAAKKLGIDKLPIIYLSHLTDEQRRAYTHIHNQLTLNSGFDIEVLEADLLELGINFEDYGFEDFSFDADLVFGLNEPSNESEEEPAALENTKIKCPYCGGEFDAGQH